jgi:hypothetical protein
MLGFAALGSALALLGFGAIVISYLIDGVYVAMLCAAYTLAATLIANAMFPFAALAFVFATRRPRFSFHPTPWSQRSYAPAALAAVASSALFAGGLTIALTCQSIAGGGENQRKSQLSGTASAEPLSLVLAILALLEAFILACAARVQAMGRCWLCLRPVASHRVFPMLAPAINLGATALALLGAATAVVSATSLAHDLWRTRVLPVYAEAVFAAHVALCCVAAGQVRRHRNSDVGGDGGSAAVLGFFELSPASKRPALCLIVTMLLGFLSCLFALPYINRSTSESGKAALELLGGLQLVVVLVILFHFSRLYLDDVTRRQPRVAFAKPIVATGSSGAKRTVWDDEDRKTATRAKRGVWDDENSATDNIPQASGCSAPPSTVEGESGENSHATHEFGWRFRELWRRRLVLAVAILAAAGCGACYAGSHARPNSLILHASNEATTGLANWPLLLAVLLLLHVPLFSILADVWASGVPAGGFAPVYRTIAADGSIQSFAARRWGTALAALASLLTLAVGALLVVALVAVEVRVATDDITSGTNVTSGTPVGSTHTEAMWTEADGCAVIFGVDAALRSSSGRTPELVWRDDLGQTRWAGLRDSFDPATHAWQQEELRLLCVELQAANHPVVHSDWHNDDGTVLDGYECLMQELHDFVRAGSYPPGGATWPIASGHFVDALLALLAQRYSLKYAVGFRSDASTGYPTVEGSRPTQIAWMKVGLKSKYGAGIETLSDPSKGRQYQLEWQTWYAGLASSVRGLGTWQGIQRPPSGLSTFDDGWYTCTCFSFGPTMEAFLAGVTRALLYTPLFSLVAMLLFLRDVYLCYAALYSIVAIIVGVLGVLGLLGFSLGPVESLSFAVVVGVSVDYLVHFAFAFKHSLMPEQYYKSRTVLLARSGSTLASGVTTLCAVLPLLFAAILPLRSFGIIFTVVALVSLGCSFVLLNAILMVSGPGIGLSAHSLPRAEREVSQRTASGSCEGR